MISQVHIHHWNAEDCSFPIIYPQWCTSCICPVLELCQHNCNTMYIKITVSNVTVIPMATKHINKWVWTLNNLYFICVLQKLGLMLWETKSCLLNVYVDS